MSSQSEAGNSMKFFDESVDAVLAPQGAESERLRVVSTPLGEVVVRGLVVARYGLTTRRIVTLSRDAEGLVALGRVVQHTEQGAYQSPTWQVRRRVGDRLAGESSDGEPWVEVTGRVAQISRDALTEEFNGLSRPGPGEDLLSNADCRDRVLSPVLFLGSGDVFRYDPVVGAALQSLWS